MLFAVITAEGYVLIIGAVGAVALKALEMWFNQRQLRKAAESVTATVESRAATLTATVSDNAADVKTALAATDANKEAHLNRQDAALGAIAEKVDGVKDQTITMSAKLDGADRADGAV